MAGGPPSPGAPRNPGAQAPRAPAPPRPPAPAKSGKPTVCGKGGGVTQSPRGPWHDTPTRGDGAEPTSQVRQQEGERAGARGREGDSWQHFGLEKISTQRATCVAARGWAGRPRGHWLLEDRPAAQGPPGSSHSQSLTVSSRASPSASGEGSRQEGSEEAASTGEVAVPTSQALGTQGRRRQKTLKAQRRQTRPSERATAPARLGRVPSARAITARGRAARGRGAGGGWEASRYSQFMAARPGRLSRHACATWCLCACQWPRGVCTCVPAPW